MATADGRTYREGYELIDQRDLELRYLYRPSTVEVRGIDVTVLPNLKVGYVMGVGDQVPLGLQQLGAQVTLLGERELASADLAQFDAIMTGTRAYAVREDLKTYNQRLLDYVKAGGNMIVLYNTAGARADALRAVPGREPAQLRRGVGGGLAGRDPGARRTRPSPGPTRSPRPTSTAGSSSAARSSSARGTRPTRR